MKSIKQQYIDLQEGKMSQANFMRNLRMALPQYVTNVTSFKDSVKILKNKGILNEADMGINPKELAMGIKVEMEHTDDPAVAKKIAMDHLAENPNYYSDLKSSGVDTTQGLKSTIDGESTLEPNLNRANPKDGFSLGFFEEEMKESYFDNDPTDGDRDFDMEQRMQAEDLYDKGEQAYLEGDLMKAEKLYQAALKVGSWLGWDETDLPPYDKSSESLTEAKDEKTKWTNTSGKSMYDQFKEIDNLNSHEVLIGLDWEMEKNHKLTKEEAIKIVIKNLKKNPLYYTMADLAGIEGAEAEYLGGKSADPEAHQMQFVKGENFVDRKRGMKPVKNIEKVKKDSDKATAQKYKTSGIDLMSLIAKTVRGVKKMDPTGEKMKKVSVKENKVASTIFDKNANITKGLNKIAKGEEEKSQEEKKKDKLKEIIRRKLKEMYDGYEPMVRTGLDEIKVGDKLKHKLSGAELEVIKVDGNSITTKYIKLGDMEGKAKLGSINKTNANLIGKTYELI